MTQSFFDKPILNSPYKYPGRHWELDESGQHVDQWRALPNLSQWQVTWETARLLQHWRHHAFGSVRPFFCQIEAVETAIWLTEVAPHVAPGRRLLDYLAAANRDANRELSRLALKRATGAGRSGRIAVKAINHLGDEVMKVFRV